LTRKLFYDTLTGFNGAEARRGVPYRTSPFERERTTLRVIHTCW